MTKGTLPRIRAWRNSLRSASRQIRPAFFLLPRFGLAISPWLCGRPNHTAGAVAALLGNRDRDMIGNRPGSEKENAPDSQGARGVHRKDRIYDRAGQDGRASASWK